MRLAGKMPDHVAWHLVRTTDAAGIGHELTAELRYPVSYDFFSRFDMGLQYQTTI